MRPVAWQMRVALLFALVEPDVLENDDVARHELAQAACASGPTVSSTFMTGRPISSCEPRGDRVHAGTGRRPPGRRSAGRDD